MRFVQIKTHHEYISAIPFLKHVGTSQPTDIPVCTSGEGNLTEFAAALGLEIVSGLVIPQYRLGDGTRSDVNAALELYRECLSGIELDQNAGCVMVRADEFLWAGIALAVATHRVLFIFQEWDDLFSRLSVAGAHATVVCEYIALHSNVLARLAKASVRYNIGIITGRDFAAVTFVVAKAIAYQNTSFGQSVTIVRTTDLADESSNDRRIALSAVGGDAIDGFMSTPVDFFGVSTHGDNIDSPLGPVGILCGRIEAGRTTESHVQTCQSHGLCRRDPNEELRRLPGHRLRARFIALAACSGIGGADSVFPISLSQPLAALNGWAEAFLSSIKVVRGTSVGPLFVRAALGAGLCYGEATRLFSSVHTTVTGDETSYLLLGDAGGRLVAEDRSIHTKITWPEGAPGIEVALDAPLTSFLVLNVMGAPIVTREGEPLQLTLTGRDGVSPHPAFAALARIDDGAGLLVILFSTEMLPALRLRIDIAELARMATEQEVVAIEHNLTQLRWMHENVTRDIPQSQMRTGQAGDLLAACDQGEEALRLSRALQSSKPRMVRCDEVAPEATSMDIARAILRQTDLALAQAIPAWHLRHSIGALYDVHVRGVGTERRIGSCHICGSFLYEVDLDGCIRPDVHRVITHCQRCGVISDRPRSALSLLLTGPDSVRPGSRITVCVRAKHGEPQLIAAALVTESLPWLDVRSHPQVQAGMIGGPENSEMSFDLDVDASTLPGVYYIMLCSIANLGLSITSKPLRIEHRGFE